ncbi:hypothetical protein HWV07_17980 [Natronomonas salina]|uniref:hypothetical protein n=1 Tax=Natronomonas salina TaxID=1710540 RepID=UPI0015B4C469|nr:hypothetical protein [Natronomonas salina]QLD90827.1 hypothetical protein HWV07_17980 [Natronomonas salina]
MKRIAVSAGVLVALVAVAVMAAGGVGATTQADTGNEANGSFGAEISSFMQASSAEAEGEVDDGMFNAAMNRTEDPDERRELVERRQERLQERQARLEERRSQISADDGADIRDRALAVHVTVGASNLERSVNGTERAAQASGVDTESLNEIRTSARDLRGSEVAELARSVSGRSAGERGPPTDVPGRNGSQADGPSTNRSNGSGLPVNIGAGEPGNGSGPNSSDRDRGRPDDAGPPENETGNESSEANETGNDNSESNETGNESSGASDSGADGSGTNESRNESSASDDSGNESSTDNDSGNDDRADGGQGSDQSGSDGSPNDERGNGQGGPQADSDDR